MGKIFKRTVVCILLSVAIMPALSAQSRGDDLTIKIAIMGPGDELYFWWGHIALVIDDTRAEQSRFYDYGLFSFANENFFTNFAFGRLWYTSGVSSAANNIAGYVHTNRDVVLYTLDIPPEKREEVWQYAERSVLPENRDYLYHHFRHNCTNPILEAIDMATNGQFKTQLSDEPGRFTLRQHVRRHTWFSPFIDWILNFWMGQGIDTGITVWDELFLPSEIGACISNFSYIDSDDMPHPLVSDVEVIHRSSGRAAVLDIPLKQWPREFILSLLVALILGLLFYVQTQSTARGQVALGMLHSLFGLLFGGAGLVLFFLSFFTDHDYTFHNANLLFANPLLLVAVPLGFRYAASRNYDSRLRAEFILRLLWLLVVLGIFISMLIKLLPQFFWQDNLTDQLLILPIALVLALEPAGLKRMIERVFWRWL